MDSLREKTWRIVEPNYTERLAGIISMFEAARCKDLGADDLEQVFLAASSGRIATILIEADRQIPGRADTMTGELEFGDLKDPDVDDLLDDMAELVLKTGG